MSLVNKLLNSNIAKLQPYESARRLFSGQGSSQWLNANESPYSNKFEVDSDKFNRYPDCQPAGLLSAYAQYAQVSPQQLLITRGADEGIELLIRAFCAPGKDNILICPPTYGMYAISAETFNVGIKQAPLEPDFGLDVSAITSFKNQVKLVFICSPNNPTGTIAEAQKLRQILDFYADSALVVVDEAYIEFSMDSQWSSQLADYPNLVVLRTLSKAFALAGIRCGFTLGSQEVIKALLKVIAPYPVPDPVAQIASQALSLAGVNQCKAQVEIIKQQLQMLKAELTAINDIEFVGDDNANFILIRTKSKQELMSFLVAGNIVIRDQSKQMALKDCLRITIGTEQQNQDVVLTIKKFFELQESQS